MPTRFSDMGGVLAFAMLDCCVPHSECPKPGLETNIFMPACLRWALPIFIISFKIILLSMVTSELLKLNGFTLVADESVFETLVLQAAQGQVGKDAVADFFRENTKS